MLLVYETLILFLVDVRITEFCYPLLSFLVHLYRRIEKVPEEERCMSAPVVTRTTANRPISHPAKKAYVGSGWRKRGNHPDYQKQILDTGAKDILFFEQLLAKAGARDNDVKALVEEFQIPGFMDDWWDSGGVFISTDENRELVSDTVADMDELYKLFRAQMLEAVAKERLLEFNRRSMQHKFHLRHMKEGHLKVIRSLDFTNCKSTRTGVGSSQDSDVSVSVSSWGIREDAQDDAGNDEESPISVATTATATAVATTTDSTNDTTCTGIFSTTSVPDASSPGDVPVILLPDDSTPRINNKHQDTRNGWISRKGEKHIRSDSASVSSDGSDGSEPSKSSCTALEESHKSKVRKVAWQQFSPPRASNSSESQVNKASAKNVPVESVARRPGLPDTEHGGGAVSSIKSPSPKTEHGRAAVRFRKLPMQNTLEKSTPEQHGKDETVQSPIPAPPVAHAMNQELLGTGKASAEETEDHGITCRYNFRPRSDVQVPRDFRLVPNDFQPSKKQNKKKSARKTISAGRTSGLARKSRPVKFHLRQQTTVVRCNMC